MRILVLFNKKWRFLLVDNVGGARMKAPYSYVCGIQEIDSDEYDLTSLRTTNLAKSKFVSMAKDQFGIFESHLKEILPDLIIEVDCREVLFGLQVAYFACCNILMFYGYKRLNRYPNTTADIQLWPQWPIGMVSVSGPDCSKHDTSFHPRTVAYMGLVRIKSDIVGQTSVRWCGAEVWRGGPGQVSSSSSDRD
ncbi:hypothetical protein AVEN_210800-1 [Araneus ventricosus]|uniref:Uncharacterized protein n=1 Tax=Araneus ventricosus TaxID=182803 RepID=A0A4Y2CKY2_ARAVE|nr:hypothetical protein AVEN_210800-1 [Araneus ventricosus]